MAKSKTEICNLAVGWLGGNRLTSVDDDQTKEAELCRDNYDLSRKAVLEEREWTFAIKRASVTPLTEVPLFGYNYKFLLPSDLLDMINAYDPRHSGLRNPPGIPHVIEGDEMYADLETVNIKFIFDLRDTNKFSGLFDQALAAHIAANISIPLTENAKQFERMMALYEINLEKAITSDSLQGSNERIETSQLEKARRMFVRPQ
jgi:hypothetical protein